MKKLRFIEICSISMMLFAMFFGAGNMIFPPAMGQQAGTNYLSALAGFITTDAGIAILGIAAVVMVGTSVSQLGSLISRRFGIILSVCVYLLIGPLFALPRTGSVSFELALLPFIAPESKLWFSLLFTAIFFLLTYYLSSNPNRIVDIVGKCLTPLLLISIVCIFLGCLLYQGEGIGTIGAPQGDYASIAFFKGMVEGYNALDGPAGLAFAIVVILAIKRYGVTDQKSIVKYTILCGIGAAALLSVIYFALSYIGAATAVPFENGGALLSSVTTQIFGKAGAILLGIAVLMACLTTSIGLTTSFADYFHQELLPTVSYKKIAAVICFFSFVISNIGLTQLIAISLPVLIMIYPVTVVLCILSFFKGTIQNRRMVYILGMAAAFAVSFINGLDSAGIQAGTITVWMQRYVPLYSLSLGWVLPAMAGALIGFLPIFNRSKQRLSGK